MAYIISLCGKPNTGKTKVLNDVINDVERKTNALECESFPHGKRDQVFYCKINNKKVGITTRGDRKKDLNDDFNDMGICDVYVCACRTQGCTQDFLSEREKNEKDIVVFFHTWEEDDKSKQDSRDGKKKKEIYDAIKYFVELK